MSSFFQAILIIIIGLNISSEVSAEPSAQEKPFGRLSSGEAYRVDAQGFRLVDRLAELEVTNDDLQRQVVALEDEIADKRQTIQALTGGDSSKAKGAIAERDLLGNVPLPTLPEVRALPRVAALPAANVLASTKEMPTKERCAVYLSDYQNKIHSLEQELESKPVCDTNLEGKYQQQMTSLVEEMEDKNSKISQLQKHKEQSNMEIASFKQELSKQESNADIIITKNEEIIKLQKAFESTLASNVALKEELLKQEQKVALVEQGLALAKSKKPSSIPRARLASPKRTTTSRQRSRHKQNEVVELAKSDLHRQLGGIQSLIGKRKRLLDSLKSRSSGVSVKIQPLVANNGMSLDRLRSKVKNLNNTHQVSNIRRGLSQIEGILRDDIQVLKRLAKI